MTGVAEDASSFVPVTRSVSTLRKAAKGCRSCLLYRRATQTVFGEGPARSRVVLVGEQPGSEEDRQGHPFVGPAGGILSKALADAGLERDDVYVTNAVKHFKFEERGKRRIHKKPNGSEIGACRPWLAAELDAIRPRVVVALGVTARRSLADLGEERAASRLVSTVHPSAVLRGPDHKARAELYSRLVADLREARKAAYPKS